MRQFFPEVILKSGAEKQEVADEKVESREGFFALFLFESSDGASECCWEKSGGEPVLTVSVVVGLTGGAGRQAPRAGGGLAVEEDHSNEDRGGLGVLRQAGWLETSSAEALCGKPPSTSQLHFLSVTLPPGHEYSNSVCRDL